MSARCNDAPSCFGRSFCCASLLSRAHTNPLHLARDGDRLVPSCAAPRRIGMHAAVVTASLVAHGIALLHPSCPSRFASSALRHAQASAVLSDEAEQSLSSREARRRARLLGDVAGGTTDDELSGFEELFANLREEEEKAIVAAHEQELVTLLEELEGSGEDAASTKQPLSTTRQPASRSPLLRSLPLYAPAPAAVSKEPPNGAVRAPQSGPASQLQWGAAGADGLETASVGGQMVTLMPTRVMIFVDGTWLYYQLFGRGKKCEITRRWGERWWETHHIDYSRLPQVRSPARSRASPPSLPFAPSPSRSLSACVRPPSRASDCPPCDHR